MTWKLARSKPGRGRAEMQGSSVPLGRNHVSPLGAPSHCRALRIVLTFPPLRRPCSQSLVSYQENSMWLEETMWALHVMSHTRSDGSVKLWSHWTLSVWNYFRPTAMQTCSFRFVCSLNRSVMLKSSIGQIDPLLVFVLCKFTGHSSAN